MQLNGKDIHGGGIVEEKKYYSTKEAADYLGILSRSIYTPVYKGLLVREMHNGNQCFTKEALDAYKNKQEQKEDTSVKSAPTPSSNGQHAVEAIEEHPKAASGQPSPEMSDAIRYVSRLVEAATCEKERSGKLLEALRRIGEIVELAIKEYEGSKQ